MSDSDLDPLDDAEPDVCGPCGLDVHADCHWLDGGDCACRCHMHLRRFIADPPDGDRLADYSVDPLISGVIPEQMGTPHSRPDVNSEERS